MARTSKAAASAASTDANPTDVPKFDLHLGKTTDFVRWLADLQRWFKDHPAEVSLPDNGWHDVTPALAFDWLRLNKPTIAGLQHGKNREADLSTVRYYAAQMMQQGGWKPTGQPVLFSSDSVLQDAQHRLLAGYLSGATFRTYVVADVPPDEQLFAYIDNSRPRSPAAALQTAGYNGRSTLVSQVLKMLDQFINGAYTPTSIHTRPRLTPIQYITMGEQHPGVSDACRLAVSDYGEATTALLGNKSVVALATLLIIEGFGADVADAFFDDLANADPTDFSRKSATNDPVVALRALMADEARKGDNVMRAHVILGNLIKAFNAWHAKVSVRKLGMLTHEEFPRFDSADEQQQQEAA